MSPPRLLALPSSITLVLAMVAAPSEFRVEPDQQNVAASRLEGVWEPDQALAERLGTPARFSSIEISEDGGIAEKIPAKFEEFLADQQIFMAGTCTLRREGPVVERFPFILTTHSGNPHLVLFRELGGDPLGDAESVNVLIVRANHQADDIFFLGGDELTDPFTAYKRTP